MVKLFCELLKIVLARSCSLLFKGAIISVAYSNEKKDALFKINCIKNFQFQVQWITNLCQLSSEVQPKKYLFEKETLAERQTSFI